MDERVREISYRVAEELDLVDSLVKLRDKVEREARNREEIKKNQGNFSWDSKRIG